MTEASTTITGNRDPRELGLQAADRGEPQGATQSDLVIPGSAVWLKSRSKRRVTYPSPSCLEKRHALLASGAGTPAHF